MALNVGSRLGHYDVTALIGEGGMGQVRLWRRIHRPASVLVIMALGLSGWAAHAQVTDRQPKILFDGGDPPTGMNNKQIYVMDPDGSHVQSLTETPPGTISGWAAWSPDRQKIAFVSGRGEDPGDPEIYVMAADGSDVRQLTRHKGLDGI